MVIDGTTEPDFTGTPIIELDGQLQGGGSGLVISGGGSTIRGLVINRFLDGIRLETNGGNTIVGNYVGTDATGTAALGNVGAGVSMVASNNNLIGGIGAEPRQHDCI